VFENRVLRRIFGPNRDDVTGRKLHNEELNDLYYSPNIIPVIISRTMIWARHEARVGEMRGLCRVLVEKPEEIDNLEDPGVDGRIILRWTGLIWLRTGTGNERL